MNTTSSNTSSPTLIWSGLDLAKRTFAAAIWGHQPLPSRQVQSFPRTAEGAQALLGWLMENAAPDTRLGLMMEATGVFATELAAWLLELDPTLHIAIVNPRRTCGYISSLGLRNKTDAVDARALAGFGHERRPEAWERQTPEHRELRDLIRTCASLVEQRVALQLSLRDHDRTSKLAGEVLNRLIHALEKEIGVVEKGIAAHVKVHPTYAHWVKHLTSIKGVGLITAVTTLAELGDLRRFPRSRQISAFAGVSPKRKESGTSVKGKTHLCHQGSRLLRSTLYMAAQAAARFNPDLAAFYAVQAAAGKHHRSILGMIMRKLLILMRAVVIAEADWVPQAEWRRAKQQA